MTRVPAHASILDSVPTHPIVSGPSVLPQGAMEVPFLVQSFPGLGLGLPTELAGTFEFVGLSAYTWPCCKQD